MRFRDIRAQQGEPEPVQPVPSQIVHATSGVPRAVRRSEASAIKAGNRRRTRKAQARIIRTFARHGAKMEGLTSAQRRVAGL
jgi:hypothetical protein